MVSIILMVATIDNQNYRFIPNFSKRDFWFISDSICLCNFWIYATFAILAVCFTGIFL